MFMFRYSKRTLHTSSIWLATDKILLSKLRKSTGYTFANCKKALDISNNDLTKAEAWLKEQALALGWAKAAKLVGRSALQGLIAVTTDKKTAAMVEINCETDFVAKNTTFQNLATKAATTCFSLANEQTNFNESIAKSYLDGTQLNKLTSPDGKLLGDEVALLVSQVGENISLRRASLLKVTDDLSVAGCTHPFSSSKTATLLGKYGTLLVYKTGSDEKEAAVIAKQLCQHVIGMKPTIIGDIEKDLPKENKEEETVMIHQEFIMEAETTVFEVLQGSNISIIEFTRFQCGEDINEVDDGREEKEVQANTSE